MDTSKVIARKAVKSNHCAGFSLVEIVLALGIIAFAFVAIFGLIPAGLTNFRQAMETSVTSQVAQRMVNDAQQTDFVTLTTTPSTIRYFDDQGAELPSALKARSIYQVITRVTSPVDLGGGVQTNNNNAASVVVQIATNPANRTLNLTNGLFAPVTGVKIVSFNALVARTE